MKRTVVALIDEARCIGCARCIAACPVDAIAGAQGFMHTVITVYCTGCELCLPPCPVDCIDLVPPPRLWTDTDARAAKHRTAARKKRLNQMDVKSNSPDRRAEIAAALKRKQRP